MAQEHVPGRAGRVRYGSAQCRGVPQVRLGVRAGLAVGLQEPGDGREPHHYRAADINRRPPPARADQLVISGGQRRRKAGRGERPGGQVIDPHQWRPGRGIGLAQAAPGHRLPDQLPARRRRPRVHRPANGHEPVPEEGINVHPAMMTRQSR